MSGNRLTFRFFLAVAALALFAVGIATALPTRPAEYGRWAMVNHHRIYFEMRGAGPPLVLLHGGGDSINRSFSKQLEVFAAGHRIIAPEQVGQGHTPDVPGLLSYTGMMEDTAELLRQLHVSQADVIGWSDGGIIGLMLAARHPELVRRLVVSGANIAPDGLEESEIAGLREDGGADAVPTDIDGKLRWLWLNAPTTDELNAGMLSRLEQPVLVMAGDHDVIRLDHTLSIYHAIPHAELYILPDTGHSPFNERPQSVNPVVLSFLQKG